MESTSACPKISAITGNAVSWDKSAVAKVCLNAWNPRFRCTGSGTCAIRRYYTLNELIAGKRVSWVLEADLKNFFGSLDHLWMMRFVEHRGGDPRLLSLIRRWLKVGVLEGGRIHESTEGTPQGGSISVLLSNVYLHYGLDLWFTKAIKPKLRGEAYLVRYIDDFVVCFEHRQDADRFQWVLSG